MNFHASVCQRVHILIILFQHIVTYFDLGGLYIYYIICFVLLISPLKMAIPAKKATTDEKKILTMKTHAHNKKPRNWQSWQFPLPCQASDQNEQFRSYPGAYRKHRLISTVLLTLTLRVVSWYISDKSTCGYICK